MKLSWAALTNMPSTNVRIAASILAMLATTVRVVGFGWEPSWEWYGFLTVWAGLDIAQFSSKRLTDSAYVAAKTSGEPPKDPPADPKPPEIGT